MLAKIHIVRTYLELQARLLLALVGRVLRDPCSLYQTILCNPICYRTQYIRVIWFFFLWEVFFPMLSGFHTAQSAKPFSAVQRTAPFISSKGNLHPLSLCLALFFPHRLFIVDSGLFACVRASYRACDL